MNCERHYEFKAWERPKLEGAIAVRRHYIGENEHRTVPHEEAEVDFACHSLFGCGELFRAEYCSKVCDVENCEDRKKEDAK